MSSSLLLAQIRRGSPLHSSTSTTPGSIVLVGSLTEGKDAWEVYSVTIVMKSHDRDKRVDNSVLIFHIFTAPYSSTAHVICSTRNPMIVTGAIIKGARCLGDNVGHGTGI